MHSELTIDQQYNEMLPVIKKVTRLHWQKYGGDFNDWLGEANLLFMEACRTFEKDKVAFSSWLWIKVRCGLLDIALKEIRRDQILKRKSADELTQVPAKQHFSLKSFMRDLSDDSKTLIRVAVISDRKWRSSMSALKWEESRFNAAMAEIQEALAESTR